MARTAKRARASTKPKKPTRKPTRRESVEHVRELALEAAIIEAPDDPLPRLVYGDWIQAAGQRRGEWVALSAAVEAEPQNVRLRAAAVAFLDEHRGALLGDGAALLPGAWIGWRGGFIDELRLQPVRGQRKVLPNIAALLAHPSCRFLRHIALGELPHMQDVLDTVADAAPPLLETLVVLDRPEYIPQPYSIDRVAALPSLRRLGVKDVAACGVKLPGVIELHVVLDHTMRGDGYWFVDACQAVEELTLDSRTTAMSPANVADIVTRLPALRRLRLLNIHSADPVVAALTPLAHRFELLDIAHAQLTDTGATALLEWPTTLQLLALRTAISAPMEAELRARFRSVAVSRPPGPPIDSLRDDDDGVAWLSHRVVADGRDALRIVPGAGYGLYQLGRSHSVDHREARALPMLEAAVTMPATDLHTWPWASAALAHERLMHFDEAELLAREGLLRGTREPNFFAIVVDALRRSNRLAEAVAELPRAYLAMTHVAKARQGVGGSACLLDCLFTLAQAGRHDDTIALARKYATLMKADSHFVIAMSQIALGREADAKASMTLAKKGVHAVMHHARAVMCLAGGKRSTHAALVALAKLKQAGYPEWHWIATDPNLAKLRGNPKLDALLA